MLDMINAMEDVSYYMDKDDRDISVIVVNAFKRIREYDNRMLKYAKQILRNLNSERIKNFKRDTNWRTFHVAYKEQPPLRMLQPAYT